MNKLCKIWGRQKKAADIYKRQAILILFFFSGKKMKNEKFNAVNVHSMSCKFFIAWP